ncbi:GGDEF domain-containing protein [Deinococcus sp. KSM4-11]|uniref:GGDEF domain-containing protein n=1 Tax=Deinococcus sp. KSM4-11 TaxID=2568654 RepID=UPI0010A35133|nr:GGDEF domain-containing protein [Deinococcus sp. KSM4-11]THF85525.1 GGDEF domain-containing protein [Deinococcus sp. KSM4-11]
MTTHEGNRQRQNGVCPPVVPSSADDHDPRIAHASRLLSADRPPNELWIGALLLTVFVTLAMLVYWGGLGWFATVPLVILYSSLWPRHAFVMPVLGLALSVGLYGLARHFGAPTTPVLPTALLHLTLTGAVVLVVQPTVRLRLLLHETLERAAADQQKLEVMAELAQVSARGHLGALPAAEAAEAVLRKALSLGGVTLVTSIPDGPLTLNAVGSSGAVVPEVSPGSPLWEAHLSQQATFMNGGSAPAATLTLGGRPTAWAMLPLHVPGDARFSLLVLGSEATGQRWGVQERQLLTAAARAIRSATERHLHVTTLDTLANHDVLTGCLNRRAFTRTLKQLDSTPAHRGYGLAVMDLDGFKRLNDRAGHAQGDEVLRIFAGVVRQTFFARDSLYRLGGDEFALILRDVPMEDLATLTAKVSALPGAEVVMAREAVGVSVGVAHASEAQTAAEVLALADQRMYANKRGKTGGALHSTRQPQA